MTRQLLFFLFSVLLLFACKKKAQPDFHFDYFGMEQGRFVVYDVKEINHFPGATVLHDTVTYQLKTVWGEIYIDNEGREGRLYRRYKRNNASETWELKDVWSGLINGNKAELVEENQRKIKLVFAPSVSKEWDANAYNMEGELKCFYQDIHQPYSLGNNSFDSTVTVELGFEEPNAIHTFKMNEVYANNIGLIYKVYQDLNYDFADPEVQSGSELFYTCISSGKQ